MKKHYDVALVGVATGANYGSMLTYYSIAETIKSFNKTVLVVNKVNAEKNDPEVAEGSPVIRFVTKYNDLSKIYNFESISELNELADTFVVGTDQVWNYGISKGFKDTFYLGFVNDDRRKVSLAASCGHSDDFTPKDELEKYKRLFNRFNAISVREDSAVDLLRNKYEVNATQIIEPIFWIDTKKYLEMSSESTKDISGQYLLSYILDETTEKKMAVKEMARKLNLEIKSIPDGFDFLNKKWDPQNTNSEELYTPEDFLALFLNSQYVITDSFHGTAFALKFNKPFVSIANEIRGLARFETLFRIIGSKERQVENGEALLAKIDVLSKGMDYSKINQKIDEEIIKAHKWIERALHCSIEDKVKFDSNEIEDKLTNSLVQESFVFYRRGEVAQPISISVKFNRDGTISGFSSNNEKFWRVKGNILYILNDNYIATTSFEIVQNDFMDNLSIEGVFFANNKIVHILESKKLYDSRNILKKLLKPEKFGVQSIDNREIKDFFLSHTFDFYKAKAKQPMYPQISLLPDGTVEYISNIAYWSVNNLQLIFFDINKSPKITFDVAPLIRTYEFTKFRAVGRNFTPDTTEYVLYISKLNNKKAIPTMCFSRVELIQTIRINQQINSWKRDLLSLNPHFEMYIGRELKEYTHNFVGGPADVLIFPNNKDDVSLIMKYAYNNGIPVTTMGNGSNILIRDGGIRGIVINMTQLSYHKIENDNLVVGAGATLIETSYFLLEKHKSGLEWANNIPGTIGGAVFMNAGTHKDINGIFISASVVNERGEIKHLEKSNIIFKHRFSSFMNHPNWIIVEAKFKLEDVSETDMSLNMAKTVQNREMKHPLENPNHGSTFTWWRAARLIQEAGLVGKKIGGVEVSVKFPNFFLNVDNGTAADYEALIYNVVSEVYEFSGFLMKIEVQLMGMDIWEATNYFN